MMPLLLDTCAVIWLGTGEPVGRAAATALDAAAEDGIVSYVSPITAWELGLLSSRGRMPVRVTARYLLYAVMKAPGISYSDLSPDILIEASHLPGNPPRDPADRMIISTARSNTLTIMTRDRAILSYAEKGHVLALAC
jgi:PIN domain nuclease of toxin-antitoxin system